MKGKRKILILLIIMVMSFTAFAALACNRDDPPPPATYTVKFDKNYLGTVNDIPDKTNIVAGATIDAPTQPTRTNYDFSGWYLNSGGTGSAWNFATDTVTAARATNGVMTLYAKWDEQTTPTTKHTVKLISNGTTVFNEQVNAGSKITEPTGLSNGNLVLSAWYKNVSGLGIAWDFENDNVADDTTLYAVWDHDWAAEGYTAITTADELYAAVKNTNASAKFYLANDIDLANYEWKAHTTTFKGIFEGNNKQIINFYQNTSGNGGLFNDSNTAEFRNIVFVNPIVTSTTNRAAVLLGNIASNATVTIDNIKIFNAEVKGNHNNGVAAIVGHTSNNTVLDISNIYIKDGVFENSLSDTGVIIGVIEGSQINITNAYIENLTLKATNNTGGLVGQIKSSGSLTVDDAVLTDISIEGKDYVSAIIGELRRNSGSVVSVDISNVFFSNGAITSLEGRTDRNGQVYGINGSLGTVVLDNVYVTDTEYSGGFTDQNDEANNVFINSDDLTIDASFFENNFGDLLDNDWVFENGIIRPVVAEPEFISVKYLDTDGTELTELKYFEGGKLIDIEKMFKIPAKESGKITEWFNESTKWDFSIGKAFEGLTLKAQKRNALIFTVSFDLKDGTPQGGANEYDDKQVEEATTMTAPVAPAKSGYRFDGWYYGADAGTKWDFADAVKSELDLWAKWVEQVEITFETGTETIYQSVDKGGKITKPTNITKDNHRLAGWFVDSLEGEEWNFSDTTNENMTLVAKWVKQVTVNFDTNGADTENIPSQTIDKNTTTQKPEDPAKTNYSFEGWFVGDVNGAQWNFSDNVAVNMTLVAKWESLLGQEYTVTFKTADGSSVLGTASVFDGQHITAADIDFDIPDPAKGYLFGGWNTGADNSGTEWKIGVDQSQYYITTDLTLYVSWIQGYLVSFENNSVEIAWVTIDPNADYAGKKLTEPAINKNISGFVFDGWIYGSPETKWDFAADTVTGNLTLSVKWLTAYFVVFDLNGADSALIPAQKVASGAKVQKPADPVKAENSFVQWSLNTADGSAWDFDSDTVAGNITLVAKWQNDPWAGYTAVTDAAGLAAAVADETTTAKYYLANDIDLSAEPAWTVKKATFKGIFDGNNKQIIGLNITAAEKDAYGGLFSRIGVTVEIKNIIFVNATINITIVNSVAATVRSGLLAGYVNGATATIKNITIINGQVSSGDGSGIGILFGHITSSSNLEITNVYIYKSSTRATTHSGAIAGFVQGGSIITLENVYLENVNISSTSSSSAVGGLFGQIKDANTKYSIKNIVMDSVNISSGNYAAVVVGEQNSGINTTDSSIQNVFFIGSIKTVSGSNNRAAYTVGSSNPDTIANVYLKIIFDSNGKSIKAIETGATDIASVDIDYEWWTTTTNLSSITGNTALWEWDDFNGVYKFNNAAYYESLYSGIA